MKTQSYKHHTRFYIPHLLVFYPIILVLMGFSTCYAVTKPEQRELWIVLDVFLLVVGWLSVMVRHHYGMTLQDRIILLELRYRYFTLTGERLEPLEEKLRKSQLIALRFASDAELPELVQKAVAEQLSSDAIKRSVKNWKADNQRV